MKSPRFLLSLGLAVSLTASVLQAQSASAPPLRVVGFAEEVVLQAGNQLVDLRPGMGGYVIPQNVGVSILSGRARLLAGTKLIEVSAGDEFTYVSMDEQPRLWVQAGAPKADGRAFLPGEAILVGAAPPPPPPPPPLQPPAAPVPEPSAREAPSPVHVQIELHPHYEARETYDDNIFLVARDKPGPDTVGGGVLGAWITENKIGTTYSAPFDRRNKLQGSVDLSAANYSRQAAVNDAYDTEENVSYAYSGRALKALLSNAYQNTEIPAFSELVVRQRHWDDATKLDLEWTQGRRFVYGVDASHDVTKYVDHTLGGLLNHYDQLFGGRFGLQFGPKTKAFLSYHRGITHYSAGRNAGSKSHQADASVEGKLLPKLTGAASAGFQYRLYDGAAGLPAAARDWQTNVSVRYDLARGLAADLKGFRNFSESTFGGNRYYTATGADLAMTWTLRRLTANLRGTMEIDRYPEAVTVGLLTLQRRDDLYSFALGAGYKIAEWLRTDLSFSRLARFSIFSREFNYSDDRTSLELKASL